MPIEIPRTPAAEETVRIRFVRNKSYAGRDYGPDFPEQAADVRADWAKDFLRRGAAVLVAETANAPEPVADAADAAPEPVKPARKKGK